jgi:hypothetical protein
VIRFLVTRSFFFKPNNFAVPLDAIPPEHENRFADSLMEHLRMLWKGRNSPSILSDVQVVLSSGNPEGREGFADEPDSLEEKCLHLHKAVLSRIPHFMWLFNETRGSEAQNRISIINVENCGQSALEVFFEYVYLGEIHCEKLEEVQEVIEFWHLAGYYEDEYAVKSCARMILEKSLIGPDNFLSFRKEAEKLDSKEVLTALKELQRKYPKHYPQE